MIIDQFLSRTLGNRSVFRFTSIQAADRAAALSSYLKRQDGAYVEVDSMNESLAVSEWEREGFVKGVDFLLNNQLKCKCGHKMSDHYEGECTQCSCKEGSVMQNDKDEEFYCRMCKHRWKAPASEHTQRCPECGSIVIDYLGNQTRTCPSCATVFEVKAGEAGPECPGCERKQMRSKMENSSLYYNFAHGEYARAKEGPYTGMVLKTEQPADPRGQMYVLRKPDGELVLVDSTILEHA